MNAVAAVQAPAHPRPPQLDDEHLRDVSSVRVTGLLTCDAELRMTVGKPPHRLLIVKVQQHHGLPYEAAQDCGCEPAQHLAAEAKARLLKRGALVAVYARTLEPGYDHGHAVIRLRGVIDVIPHRVDRPHTGEEDT